MPHGFRRKITWLTHLSASKFKRTFHSNRTSTIEKGGGGGGGGG